MYAPLVLVRPPNTKLIPIDSLVPYPFASARAREVILTSYNMYAVEFAIIIAVKSE